jgi:hypothetical protein
MRGGLALALLLLAAAQSSAAIVYVDATTSNTVHAPSAGGGAWNAAAVGDTAADNIWRLRANFGNLPTTTVPPSAAFDTTGGTIYESTGNNCCDDVPRVVTSATVPAGLKDVFAYFWSDQAGSPWRIRAGLTDSIDPLPLFTGGTPAVANPPSLVDTGGRDSASRVLWRAYVGQTLATALSVYIDDAPATSGIERTWYDGIGYEVVVPEPSCFVLFGLGLSWLFVDRRAGRASR